MMNEYTWSEYLEALTAIKQYGKKKGSDWTDGESFASALRKMRMGDDTYAHMADKLLDQISDLSDGIPVREWAPSPIGAYPVVPEFLSGMPTCMRQLSATGELSPVKIVVSSTCSGGINKETMTRRGVAILALVIKLQQIRPVELYILVEGNDEKVKDNLFQMIRLDTKPLSIAHACFALANVGFARALTYAHMMHNHMWHGDWPKAYRANNYETLVRSECQLAPDDLWIRSAFYYDTMLQNPVEWVNAQLAKYGASQE